jgi:hypothetical protein
MSEQDQFSTEEKQDDEVEAHKHKALAHDEGGQQDDDSNDDFEAHKHKAL